MKKNRVETRVCIELSNSGGIRLGAIETAGYLGTEPSILVLVLIGRPRSRPYKKSKHATNATATAPTGRYNTISRNRRLHRSLLSFFSSLHRLVGQLCRLVDQELRRDSNTRCIVRRSDATRYDNRSYHMKLPFLFVETDNDI